jgi:hypothetical protein
MFSKFEINEARSGRVLMISFALLKFFSSLNKSIFIISTANIGITPTKERTFRRSLVPQTFQQRHNRNCLYHPKAKDLSFQYDALPKQYLKCLKLS